MFVINYFTQSKRKRYDVPCHTLLLLIGDQFYINMNINELKIFQKWL
jgi:hypothetical protein